METRALLQLSALRQLILSENPTMDRTAADWIYNLPTSLDALSVTGNSDMTGGIVYGRRRRLRHVRSVPCITQLTRLTWLSFQLLRGLRPVEWNQTTCLGGLRNLTHLEISACGLKGVPDAVVGLSSLRWLCLGGNRLRSLPVGTYLGKLINLVLVDNKFCSVPLEAVAAATVLTRLHMGGNPLVWTPPQEEGVKHLLRFERTVQGVWGIRGD
jgi:Leucine-rich repeat (LRR) protein